MPSEPNPLLSGSADGDPSIPLVSPEPGRHRAPAYLPPTEPIPTHRKFGHGEKYWSPDDDATPMTATD